MTLDVAIVGAGPAGASAARALVERGLSVAIIEKALPPRYKTCGGGVLHRASRLLELDIEAAVERDCFQVELHHHNPSLRFVVRRPQPIISMVMRDRFDHFLIEVAQRNGARLIAGTTVLKVTPRGNTVELATNGGAFSARFLIAADGVRSIVARTTGAPELNQVYAALECEVSLSKPVWERFSQTARFDLGLVPFGYAWVFPKREHLSIGVLTTRRGATNLNDCYQKYLGSLGIRQPLREERHGFMIPVRPRSGAFGVHRVLFVGDAAGFADPVTAEGITAAVLSGQLAARAVVTGNFDDLAVKEAYRRALSESLLPELRVARFLARLLYEFPRFRSALLAGHGGQLCELVTDVMMGNTTYREAVRRPSNYLRLLKAYAKNPIWPAYFPPGH